MPLQRNEDVSDLTDMLGEIHRRQRKVMLPAFGFPESKTLLPVFSHYAEQVWKIRYFY